MNRKKQPILRAKFVVMAILAANLSLGMNAWAVETVTVDFGVTKWPATQRASGFLHSISATQPSAALLNPVKPKLIRSTDSTIFSIYSRMTPLGTKLMIVISDKNGYSSFPRSDWETLVTNLVTTAKNNGYSIQWDIWNEPNLSSFWNASQAQFFDTWKRGYQRIRAVEPNATIVGPSASGFDSGYIQAFLNYAKANNVLPDVLSWHEWYGGTDIPGNVQSIKNWMASNGININRISINEMIYQSEFTSPGATARYLAGAEYAEVESAAHACWSDNGTENCFGTKSLDGILTTDGANPRSVWWVYKGYADITGNIVGVTATSGVGAIAGADAGSSSGGVVIGRIGGSGAVNVQFNNVDSASFLNNGGVRVVAQRIPDSNTGALASPTTVFDTNYTVTNDSFTVSLPNFSLSEAYILRLSPAGGTAPDNSAPTVSLSAPAGNSTVSNTVSVSANASDNVGVAGVQFKLDGANLGSEDTSNPYSISWNTTGTTNGSHTLTALARDAAGNQATSSSITVTVSNDTTAPAAPTGLRPR